MSFSKNIFQCWFQGEENLKDPKFKENVKNWKLINPGWNYALMDDSDLKLACKIFSPECLNAYNKFDTLHLKVDLGKAVLLYLHGGIIIDIDQYALRSLNYSDTINQIIDNYNSTGTPILGVSESEGNVFERMIQPYNNAVIISSPRNPLLKQWITSIINNIHNLPKDSSDFDVIFKSSGPQMFSAFIKSNMNSPLSDVVSIDYTIFEPCLLDGNCHITENTISAHKYEISWVPKRYKFIINVYYGYLRKNIIFYIIIIILINLIYRISTRCKRI